MRDGIERKLDPGEPEERNIYEAMEAGKEVKKIPMTFGDALDALEADEVVKSALPGDMYRVFMHYKRDEWERYCAQSATGTSRSTSTSCRRRGERELGHVRNRRHHLPRRDPRRSGAT